MLKPGIYRHYKGGEYELIGIARHSETLEKMVVYKALYDENGIWVRPYDIFISDAVYEGKTVTRFTWVREL